MSLQRTNQKRPEDRRHLIGLLQAAKIRNERGWKKIVIPSDDAKPPGRKRQKRKLDFLVL